MPTVTETTDPANQEFGMRIFEVKLAEGHVIDISMTQRVREDCPGEIHGSDALSLSTQVPRNGDAAAAVIALQGLLAGSLPSALSV